MSEETKPPRYRGLRVRSTKHKPVRTELYDEETGQRIAVVRGGARGDVYFELANHIRKQIVLDKDL